jgi:hypothetical protein
VVGLKTPGTALAVRNSNQNELWLQREQRGLVGVGGFGAMAENVEKTA